MVIILLLPFVVKTLFKIPFFFFFLFSLYFLLGFPGQTYLIVDLKLKFSDMINN